LAAVSVEKRFLVWTRRKIHDAIEIGFGECFAKVNGVLMTTARIERMEQKRLFVGFPVEISDSLQAALKKTKIRAQQKQMEVNWT
jgi:hypothetical protein